MSLDYVGIKPCGCLGVWASASLDRKELAKEVAKIVRLGLELKRMETADVRTMSWRCLLCTPELQKALFPLRP